MVVSTEGLTVHDMATEVTMSDQTYAVWLGCLRPTSVAVSESNMRWDTLLRYIIRYPQMGRAQWRHYRYLLSCPPHTYMYLREYFLHPSSLPPLQYTFTLSVAAVTHLHGLGRSFITIRSFKIFSPPFPHDRIVRAGN